MTKAARLYGGSLYDLALEEGLEQELLEETGTIRQLLRENPDYVSLLSEPSIPFQERCGLIDAAFGNDAQHYLVNFLKLLCEKGILREFGGCCDEYVRRYNADHHVAEAVAVSAVKLDDRQVEALTSRLEKMSGKKVHLVTKIDPSVIGGLRLELEGKLLDGTVQGRISGISRKLSEITV